MTERSRNTIHTNTHTHTISFIHWFTPWMATIAMAGSGQDQKPETSSVSLTQYASHHLLLLRCAGRKLHRKQVGLKTALQYGIWASQAAALPTKIQVLQWPFFSYILYPVTSTIGVEMCLCTFAFNTSSFGLPMKRMNQREMKMPICHRMLVGYIITSRSCPATVQTRVWKWHNQNVNANQQVLFRVLSVLSKWLIVGHFTVCSQSQQKPGTP